MSHILTFVLSTLLMIAQPLSFLMPPDSLHSFQSVQPTTSQTETVFVSTEPAASATASDSLGLSCESALLMEASTGTILYEKNAAEPFRPASITKIMTLILIFDALAENKISLEDTVTVSEYASGMGGSQVYLEPGETQTVDTMIKCISVASANDACVAYMYSRHYTKYGFLNL